MVEEPKTYGQTNISEEVIATIAGIAAVECFGLVGMSSRKLKDGIAELLKRENLSKGVEVLIEDNEITIDLFIVVAYGVKISEVCHNVMEKVKYTVENMTGMRVKNVNVNVQGVRVDAEE
jgi:uncharacterized alkaline shock family protein YloU